MPIQRFREFEDARRALWTEFGADDLAARIRRTWRFSRRLAPIAHPRGMWMFRSIEEANEHRAEWVASKVEQLARRSRRS